MAFVSCPCLVVRTGCAWRVRTGWSDLDAQRFELVVQTCFIILVSLPPIWFMSQVPKHKKIITLVQ
jgi:hypothetical protein